MPRHRDRICLCINRFSDSRTLWNGAGYARLRRPSPLAGPALLEEAIIPFVVTILQTRTKPCHCPVINTGTMIDSGASFFNDVHSGDLDRLAAAAVKPFSEPRGGAIVPSFSLWS